MVSLSKTFGLLLVIVFLTSLFTLQPDTVKAQPKTIVVPDDYPTIQTAIDHADAGDTIFVKHGTYHTYVNATYQLTIDKPLSLIGENPDNTILDGTDKSTILTHESPYHPYVSLAFVNITSSDVTISGFTIRNCDTGIILTDSGQEPISGVKITENIIINSTSESGSFYGGGNAITHIGEEASDIIISQNNITYNSGVGVTISEEHDNNFIITDNRVGNNQDGLAIHASKSLIENNTIFQNDETGLTIDGCSNVTVKNNVINGNGAANFFPHYYGYLNNSGGLMLAFCEFLFVYNNNITGNHKYGIMFEGVNNSIVESNAVLDNGVGIRLINYIYGGDFFTLHGLGTGSQVYNNNFVGDSTNAIVDSSGPFYIPEGAVGNGTDKVSWNNGMVGNYWSDYNGHGLYVIDQNNVDHHPLTQPVNISTVAPTPNSILTIGSWFQPLIIAIAILAVVVISLLLYRRHQKTSNLRQ
jgi:parallel beta-helix repeat protein